MAETNRRDKERSRDGDPQLGSVSARERQVMPRVPNRLGAVRYLLDLDTELGDDLDPRARIAARPAATAVVFDADAGEIELRPALRRAADGPGLLVLEGVVAASVTVGDRVASELLGAGDLIEPAEPDGDELLVAVTDWRALGVTRFAILDGGFADRIRPWAQLTQTLLRRVERRAHNLNVQRAIASQPRLEVRLTLLLWHLASRWGRVEPGGIRLPLPLTHQLLGRLIGAERPSVSHALSRLSRTGAVTGHGSEWHLHGRSEDLLALLDHSGDGIPASVADAGGRH